MFKKQPPPHHTYQMIAWQTWLNRYLESGQQISMHLCHDIVGIVVSRSIGMLDLSSFTSVALASSGHTQLIFRHVLFFTKVIFVVTSPPLRQDNV